ncbi:MAG TPA: methyltransferase domain-containing protein [Acidimicrobiales bacterium]|nr:methyltransferase domain-containing protein [Acidimicrobiales bacterium]
MVISGTSDRFPPMAAHLRGHSGVALREGSHAGFDDEASATAYARHLDPAFGRRFAERALDALVVVRGARVLDVACGTGVLARLCAHVAGPSGRVVGIDPSAIAVSAARRIDPTSFVEWHRWDEGGLPFEDGTFDVVACQHALHRFPDPQAIVDQMRRVAAPGGRLGIITWGPIEENPAFAAQLDAIVKAGLDRFGVVEALLDAFALHRAEDLEQLARDAGLVDVSCQTIRLLVALPRVAEWVRAYPSLSPLSRVWGHSDQTVRVQFLARATELLRPFEHDSVLRVQASARLLVARRRRP